MQVQSKVRHRFLVLVLSLGLAGCPAGSEGTPVEAGPTGADPIAKTTQALQITPLQASVAGPTTLLRARKPRRRSKCVSFGPFERRRTRRIRFYGPSLSKGATPPPQWKRSEMPMRLAGHYSERSCRRS